MSLKGSSHEWLHFSWTNLKPHTVFVQLVQVLENNFNERVLSFIFAQDKNSLLGSGSVNTARGV